MKSSCAFRVSSGQSHFANTTIRIVSESRYMALLTQSLLFAGEPDRLTLSMLKASGRSPKVWREGSVGRASLLVVAENILRAGEI